MKKAIFYFGLLYILVSSYACTKNKAVPTPSTLQSNPWATLQNVQVPDSIRFQSFRQLNAQFVGTPHFQDSCNKLIKVLNRMSAQEGDRQWAGFAEFTKASIYFSTALFNPDSVIYAFKRAAEHFKAVKDLDRYEELYVRIAEFYFAKNQLKDAQQAIDLSRKYAKDHKSYRAGLREQIASQIAFVGGQNFQSLQLSQKSIEIFKRINEPLKTGQAELVVIAVLELVGLDDHARKYRIRAQNHFKQGITDPKTGTQAKANWYLMKLSLCQTTEEAQKTYKNSINYIDSIQDMKFKGYLEFTLARYYHYDGQLDSAIHYYQQSIETFRKHQINQYAQGAQATIYQIKIEQGKYSEIAPQIQTLIVELKAENKNNILLATYDKLRKSFEKVGQLNFAYQYFQLYQQLFRELNGETTPEQDILEEFLNYEQAQQIAREKELRTQQAEETARKMAQQRQWMLFVLTLLILASVLTLVIYRNYLLKKRTTNQLEQANQKLEIGQSRLQLSNQKLRRFAQIVSHDIMSNLDLILSAGNVLVGPKRATANLLQYYEMTHQTGIQLKNYCLGLLKEAEQAEITQDQVQEMQTIAEQVLARFTPQLESQGFQIELGRVPATTLPTSVVEQTLNNLISNALRYGGGDAHPFLEIGSSPNDHEGSWYVEDNGSGDPVVLKKMLQEKTHLESAKGQGKGLLLTQASLAEYGWEIDVQPGSKGKGLRFVVRKS